MATVVAIATSIAKIQQAHQEVVADDRWYVQRHRIVLALCLHQPLVTNDDGSLRFVLRT